MDIDVKDPKLLRWAGAILVVLVVVPLYFLTASYPITYAARKNTIKELDSRHEQLSRDLERARLLVRNLERVEQEYAILSDQWEVAQALLPDENQMPDLLRKVTAAGQQSGVEFELFRPQNAMNKGFYSDNPIEVRVNGGFHQTGVFLSRLANLNRIVNVSQLKMQGIEKQEDTPFTVKTDMLLTAYTQGGAQGAPGQGNPADEGTGQTLTAQTVAQNQQAAAAGANH